MAYANNRQTIADGRITLYQRDDVKDAIWQCRITVKGVRGYVKRTTGEKDFNKAAILAIKLLGEIDHRIVSDQPLSPSTFKAVAGQFIKAAKTRMDEGRSSEGRYHLIKGTLQRYFLPYFGKRDITMIKKKDLIEYRAWRQAYWISGPGLADKKIFHKVTPSSATLKQEWTVLRSVFSFGVEMGLVSPNAMAMLGHEEYTVGRRPAFSLEEYRTLYKFMRKWVKEGKSTRVEHDVDNLIGAGRYERSDERATQRNGFRERAFETRLGTLDLKIPKLRKGSYFPGFLEPRRTGERALVAVIQEAWIQGVSTRKVDDLVQAMGMSGISKSQVSALCKDIDIRVNSFLDRPLEGEWPYIWLDATYLKTRENGRVVSVAAIIATGVNTEGRREILGLGLGPSEAAVFWLGFLRKLEKRGLKGVKLVISDAHEGLKAAIAQIFKASWQRCRVHFMRNALAHVPKAQHQMVAAAIRVDFH